MADGRDDEQAASVSELLGSAEMQTARRADFAKRLKARLARTKKSLASKPDIASQLAQLIADLKAMATEPSGPVMRDLIESLDSRLQAIKERSHEAFASDLREECEAARLHFKALTDGFAVGPFIVSNERQKEAVVAFEYAKVAILKGVPRKVPAIVTNALSLKSSLIDAPVDFAKFRSELHEAMRVAVARKNNSPPTARLRTELPLVFREMQFIRGTTLKGKGVGTNYSLPRFIIELKQFMQSDQNVGSDSQFQLEPAVIENARNPKKSVFIPRDILAGCGEGTYYQAILHGR